MTCPKVGRVTLVPTPENCTVLNAFAAVARISMLRVSPICTVFERDMLFFMVPGPVIEFRAAVPNTAHG